MLSALDSSDVATVKPGSMSQSLLRQPKLATAGSDTLTKDIEKRITHRANQRE